MRRLSIAARLYGLLALFALLFIAFTGISIRYQYHLLLDDRIDKLQAITQAASGIAEYNRGLVERGLLNEDDAKKQALLQIAAMRFGNGDYTFVESEKAVIIAHAVPTLIGKDFWNFADNNGVLWNAETIPRAIRDGVATARYIWPRVGQTEPIGKIAIYRHYKPWQWMICAGVYTDDITAALWKTARQFASIGIAGLLVIGVLAWAVVRSISKPVYKLSNAMIGLARGEIDTAIDGAHWRDEVGRMAKALVSFKEAIVAKQQLETEAVRRREALASERKHAAQSVADNLESAVSGLARTLGTRAVELQSTARSMSSTATQTKSQASTVATAAEGATGGVQMAAAAAEQLTASIHEIGRQISQSAEITGKAVSAARHTDGIVHALADGAKKIGDVVQLISSIAAQTNLLALNATIEAARAGDAGKGFAVVASEVKNLATQTAKATEDIGAQVTQIQVATAEAVTAIEGIGARIEEVSVISSHIASAVEQQGAATLEIARNVQQTAASTLDISNYITEVSESAQETGEAASHVLGAANDLSREAEQLTSEVNRFVAEIRAA